MRGPRGAKDLRLFKDSFEEEYYSGGIDEAQQEYGCLKDIVAVKDASYKPKKNRRKPAPVPTPTPTPTLH